MLLTMMSKLAIRGIRVLPSPPYQLPSASFPTSATEAYRRTAM